MSAWQFSSACAQNGPGIPLAEPAFPSVHHAVALLDKSARREPRLHVPVVDYGVNLLLLSLMSLFNLRYLTRRPELCHEGLTPSLVAGSYRRLLLVALGCAASIVISFFSPGIAVNTYWLLLAVHFLVARRQRV